MVLFTLVIVPWSIAVLVKAARSSGEYRFAFWDGGLLLEGRTLGRAGTNLFAAFAIALSVAAVTACALFASVLVR
jgi:hypothetical protein